MKTTNKSAKFETLKSFSLLSFAQASERIFLKTHSTESRCDIEPENILFENILFENILFAGTSVHLSARKFTVWGSEGVNLVLTGSGYCFPLIPASSA